MKIRSSLRRIRNPAAGMLAVLLIALLADWLIDRRRITPELRWVESSEEYRFACLQTYRSAYEKIKKFAAAKPLPWTVIMDVDDTCLSTLDYRRAKRMRKLPIFHVSWSGWCKKEKATAVPGAASFTRQVKKLGGKVILITNRREELRDSTERNLRKAGILYDALFMNSEQSSKESWLKKIREGKAIPGEGPLKPAAIIGDREEDFYQDDLDRKYLREWGKNFFILPNPMYGSWLKKN